MWLDALCFWVVCTYVHAWSGCGILRPACSRLLLEPMLREPVSSAGNQRRSTSAAFLLVAVYMHTGFCLLDSRVNIESAYTSDDDAFYVQKLIFLIQCNQSGRPRHRADESPQIRGVVGRGRGGRRPPLSSTGGRVPPLPPLFWTEIRAKVSPLLQLVTY